jgi:hypothetical protein
VEEKREGEETSFGTSFHIDVIVACPAVADLFDGRWKNGNDFFCEGARDFFVT